MFVEIVNYNQYEHLFKLCVDKMLIDLKKQAF